MRFTRIEIGGHKRLALRGIRTISVTFTELVQLIIGTNGSCKTTLMHEISVLPVNSSAYEKHGYKTIELTHRESNYELQFTNAAGPRYTFIKDGEKINENGTATVQRELCRQHFGVDDDVMEVMFDKVYFTQLSPSKRRDWIMRLSGIDFDFAMKLFNDTKHRARAANDVVKHLDKRLTDELRRLPSKEQMEELRARCEVLTEELNFLMEAKEPNLPAREALEEVMTRRSAELRALNERVAKTSLEPVEGVSFTSLDALEAGIDVAKANLAAAKALHERASIDVSHLSDISRALESTHSTSIEELKVRAELLTSQLAIYTQSTEYERITEPNERATATDTVESLVAEILMAMPEIDGKQTALERKTALEATIRSTGEELTLLQAKQVKLQHRLEHIHGSEHANCPKCDHEWVIGVGEDEEARIRAALSELPGVIKEKEEALVKYREDLEIVTGYFVGLRRLGEVARSAPALKPLWDMLSPVFVTQGESPRAGLRVLKQWRNALEHSVTIEETEKELEELNQTISHAESVMSGDVSEVGLRLEKAETDLESTTSDVEKYDRLIAHLTKWRNNIILVQDTYEQIRTTGKKTVADLKTMQRVMLNEYISDEISHRQISLAEAEAARHRAVNAQAVVDDIKRSRDEAAEDAKTLAIMVAELSPVDGLIADHLIEFLNSFVETFNSILDQVWTYDFKLLPCKLDGAEVNYNLPFTVGGGDDQIVDDVADGSRAMREFVDFAFKFVVMIYLDLEDMPLYIDELVPSLDEQHRVNAMIFIKSIVESRRCSQLLMISHYAATHGAFSNTEVCMMDSTNIVNRPDSYNKHVVFT